MSMPSCARGSRSHDGKRNDAIVQFLLQTGLQLDECSQLMLRDASTRELVPAQTSAHTLGHTFAHKYLT